MPKDRLVLGSWREPVSRWFSIYNHMILWGWRREDLAHIESVFGSCWCDRWFPPPEHIRDPVGFCRQWLLQAQPELEAWGGDLHFVSQSGCYRQLLGQGWQEDPRLQLFPIQRWHDVIQLTTGRDVAVENIGKYRYPVHYFNTVVPLAVRTFARDIEVYRNLS